MITRRATQVLAGPKMPRSAAQWRPERCPRDPRSGSGSGGDAETARCTTWALSSRFGVASSFGRNCSALRGRARFYRNPCGTRLYGRSALSGSSRRRPLERRPRDPRSGIGQRRGRGDCGYEIYGVHPAAGSHLPAEETARPSAVVPFASSPFAHPIPQSHRRAHDDLFRGSLK